METPGSEPTTSPLGADPVPGAPPSFPTGSLPTNPPGQDTLAEPTTSYCQPDQACPQASPEEPEKSVPKYRMSRELTSVADVWTEYVAGLNGKPAVRELKRKYQRREKEKILESEGGFIRR